jgi:hypothetical protein
MCHFIFCRESFQRLLVENTVECLTVLDDLKLVSMGDIQMGVRLVQFTNHFMHA